MKEAPVVAVVVNGAEWEYAATRMLQYQALLAQPRVDLAGAVVRSLQSLPFKLKGLGAETLVPYAFDDALTEAAERAADDLIALLRRRRSETEATPVPAEGSEERRLLPAGTHLRSLATGSPAAAAAQRAVRLDPNLDGGVVEAWLARGAGGEFLGQLTALATQACAEDARHPNCTGHLTLALVAFTGLAESVKARGRSLVSRVWPWERIERAIGFAFFALAEEACEKALAGLPRRPRFDAATYALAGRTLLTPLAFCGARQALQSDLNPWGLSQSLADDLDRVWLALLNDDPNPQTVPERLLRTISAERELRVRCGRAAGVLLTRRAAIDWLTLCGGPDASLTAGLLEVACSGEAAFRQLSDPKTLLAELARSGRERRADAAGDAAATSLLEQLRRGPERTDALRELTSAYCCLAFDRVVAGSLGAARARLRDRRGETARDELFAEYAAGRLYRLSADGRPLRRQEVAQRKSEGHLFIDLKAFTQRTWRAKDLAMGDFLRKELYAPILGAAAQRIERGGDAASRPITLQNLLGDGAVFSGEVPALIDLAQAVRRICRAYGDQIRARLGGNPRELEARRAEIEQRLRQLLDRLRSEAALAEAEIARITASPPSEREQALWTGLRQRIAQLEAARQQAQSQGGAADPARIERAAAAVREHLDRLFQKVETLFGSARDEFVAAELLGPLRHRFKLLERQALEARDAAQADLRAVEEELRAHRGADLEAGLFIAFGAIAETVSIADPLFGQQRLAVAEKINEAARGTARNSALRAKLDAQLVRARAERKAPSLELPFRVFVDSAYNLLLTPELNDALDASVRDRDPGRARHAAKLVGDATLRDLARALGAGDGHPPEVLSRVSDIFNTGEALSAEALAEYLTSTAERRSWLRRAVSVAELDEEIQRLFFFPTDELDLVASIPRDGNLDEAVLFRRAGQVQFVGFEGRSPTIVYELLRADSPFAQLIKRRHLALWTAEALGEPEQTALPS